MALCSTVKYITLVFFSCVYVLGMYLDAVDALSSCYFSCQETGNGRHQRDTNPTATIQQVRLHPGVVASVVIVSLAALVAAIYIIRKYCFPQNNATYRYSVLRQLEQNTSVSEENRLSDESDEDLLE